MRTSMILFMAFVCLSALAQQQEPISADRPGLADGSSTVGDGVFQVETGVNVERDADDTLTLPTLLRYGFGDRFELRVESDFDESVAAGFKLRLTEGAVPLSIIASVQEGLEGSARLVSDIDLGNDFSLTPNVGVELAEDEDATAVFAMTLAKNIGNAQPFVDFETSVSDGDTSLIADAGVAWVVGRDTQLDVSGGVDLAGDAYPEWFVSAGYSRRF